MTRCLMTRRVRHDGTMLSIDQVVTLPDDVALRLADRGVLRVLEVPTPVPEPEPEPEPELEPDPSPDPGPDPETKSDHEPRGQEDPPRPLEDSPVSSGTSTTHEE